MASRKPLNLSSALLQQEVVEDLQRLVKAIESGDAMLADLKKEMEAVNATHQDRKTTAEDIVYLHDLLRCAKKKLAWETQMERVAKRTPEVLTKVSSAMNDPQNPPSDENRALVLRLLQSVQEAMARLEASKA